MKKHPTDETPSTDQPDLQRRRITKLIAAVTVLGTGLGVNMREVFAADVRPPADKLKWEKEPAQQPAINQFKVETQAPARPGVVQDKHVPPAEYGKITRPGATQAKPIPAKPAATQLKNVPPAEYGKVESRPGAGMLKGEVKPSGRMLKGETQGMEPLDRPAADMLKGEAQGIEPGNDKPAAHMLKGEIKPSADMLKGEAQGMDPGVDESPKGFVPR
jgi:hypothetical protein